MNTMLNCLVYRRLTPPLQADQLRRFAAPLAAEWPPVMGSTTEDLSHPLENGILPAMSRHLGMRSKE